MTAIAEHLDRKLKTMPPAVAASVEKLVLDVISVVEASPPPPAQDHEAAIKAHQEHWKRVDAMTKELDWSGFERPDQGVEEVREDW
jgi:hypothetical protein